MPSTYSKNYNIELIATGERSGTLGLADSTVTITRFYLFGIDLGVT